MEDFTDGFSNSNAKFSTPRIYIYPLLFGVCASLIFCAINRALNNWCYFSVFFVYALVTSLAVFYAFRKKIRAYRKLAFANILASAFFVISVINVAFDRSEIHFAEIYAVRKYAGVSQRKYSSEKIYSYGIEFEMPFKIKCAFCEVSPDLIHMRVETEGELKRINTRRAKTVFSFYQGFLNIPYTNNEIIYKPTN